MADLVTMEPICDFDTEKSLTAEEKFKVIRRNGSLTDFDQNKIKIAITKAFTAVQGESDSIYDKVNLLLPKITFALKRRLPKGGTIHIEDIQDQVELELMRSGEQKIARAYVLYREDRRLAREKILQDTGLQLDPKKKLQITLADGQTIPLDLAELALRVKCACKNLTNVSHKNIIKETQRNLFDKVPKKEVDNALIMSARLMIEKEPNYSYVAARLLLDKLHSEACEFLNIKNKLKHDDLLINYTLYFDEYLKKGVDLGLLTPDLLKFDIKRLTNAIQPTRDFKFTYLGLQTLYDRYFIHSKETRFELPQAFFMRVAMGLALNEDDKNARAIEFYNLLSSFDFMSSTPTLFNSGTLRPQLSSCYLTTVPDDLNGIFGAIQDNALLSKYAGGLGNDWTPVRGMGAIIKGTNGKSLGVVPFLSVANATAVAVNQGGKRKGAVCAYLETWHRDVEEFLDLRKNTGDERRRTHDMNTANWIPDLFIQRVLEKGEWTLFSPDLVPDLHDLYGLDFKKAYEEYESQAARGEIPNTKKVSAVALWRKMLSLLFETGHPWITFKDPCNLRSPQQHVGVIHSSNLCTEITLNTSQDEIAVCNLGSINLPAHIKNKQLDTKKIQNTVNTAIRMLDNVIDINYYSVDTARNSNMKHRPIGLGMMGFQDTLHQLGIPYASDKAVEFADISTETISYYAINASTNLALERGTYSSYEGSLWQQGILPIDSIELLAANRGDEFDQDRSKTLDWDTLREKVKQQGMRNSNVLAIAPTATIANITGVSQSIEPTYQNLFVKSNLSGEFTVVNPYLVRELKELNIWDEAMINDLKYYNGSISKINRIPERLKKLYATAFEIDPIWLVEAASRRQKWIDQAQSLNIYIAQASGKKLNEIYIHGWKKGLKTFYYLRSLGATSAEKSTIHDSSLNAVTTEKTEPKACLITDPDCEACQ